MKTKLKFTVSLENLDPSGFKMWHNLGDQRSKYPKAGELEELINSRCQTWPLSGKGKGGNF